MSGKDEREIMLHMFQLIQSEDRADPHGLAVFGMIYSDTDRRELQNLLLQATARDPNLAFALAHRSIIADCEDKRDSALRYFERA